MWQNALFSHSIIIHFIRVIVRWLIALLGIQSNKYNCVTRIQSNIYNRVTRIQSNKYNRITRVALKWLPSPSWSDWLLHPLRNKKNPHSTPLFPKEKNTRTWGDCMLSPFQKNSSTPLAPPSHKQKNPHPLHTPHPPWHAPFSKQKTFGPYVHIEPSHWPHDFSFHNCLSPFST